MVSVALALTTGALLCLLPNIYDSKGEDAIAMLMKTALGVYHDRTGHYPPSLVDLTPVLREVSNASCVIESTGGDSFRVEISDETVAQVAEISYRANPNGNLERFHVVNTSRERRRR